MAITRDFSRFWSFYPERAHMALLPFASDPMLLSHDPQAAAAEALINNFLFIFPLMRNGIKWY